MRSNKGVSMITLIITIIVIIILAAIAFLAAGDQVGSGQFAGFASEFGDYATNFENSSYADVTESLGVAGKVANKAQKIYATARDLDLAKFDEKLNGVIVPGGYTSTRFQTDIKDATGATVVLASSTTPVYEISEDSMKEYKGKQLYGNANGKETYWVTAEGKVFTLPGFPRTVDGEERMYITADLYYLASDGDMITADDLTTIEPVRVSGDVVINEETTQKATEAADSVTTSNGSGNPGGENNENLFATIKVGHYVSYTPDSSDLPEGVKWRVWAVNGDKVVIMPTIPVGSLKLGLLGNIDKCLSDYIIAESEIEKLCDEYISSALEITASDVTSLTLKNLEDSSDDLEAQKLAFTTAGVKYGGLKTYKSGNYHAARYNEETEKNEVSSTFIKATSSVPLTVKQTYFEATNPVWKNLPGSTTETYGDLLGTTDGWLPLACLSCAKDDTNYIVQCAKSTGLKSSFIVCSYNGTRALTHGVRPLITLSGAKLTVDATTPGDGSSENAWNIVKK